MMSRKQLAKPSGLLTYLFLIVFGFILVYPLLWLVSSSVKVSNSEIFGTASLIPQSFSLDSYREGWLGSGQYGFDVFFRNTFQLVIPTVLFTIVSSVIVSYGFARFTFPLKKLLFGLMISTLMLPNAVKIIPSYLLFKNFGWLNTYLPFIVPAAFATYPFFIFMLVQFFRGIPRELDESATIDGCNSFQTLILILLPLCKAAIFSVGLFQFMWRWNDFFNSLIYINSVSKYTLALGLRMTIDISAAVSWNQIIAMSVITMLPPMLLFFLAQNYFVEGIATTGLKG